MRKVIGATFILLIFSTVLSSAAPWESKGGFYYLAKDTRDSFKAVGAGANKFPRKYFTCDGIDFLVRGSNDWQDYGRLGLQDHHLFAVPISSGMKVDEIHLLASGSFGNSYEHDPMLHFYGDKYFYATITVMFVYDDGVYLPLSVPVFWDWFHLPSTIWSKDGANIHSVGNNPVRKDCSMYHLWFVNPRPLQPVKDLLVMDSWLGDRPFSDIFALTIKSSDQLSSSPKIDMSFKPHATNANAQAPDHLMAWAFDKDFSGWVRGSSNNWDVEPSWQAESYGHKGIVDIPACNWAGDKFSWIEKKVALPVGDSLKLQFSRHSALFSEKDKQWTDGLLRVVVISASGQEVVYEKIYSGQWEVETVDLSKFKGQSVIIRFEVHGAGQVRLGLLTSPDCDGEDALLDDIRLVNSQ